MRANTPLATADSIPDLSAAFLAPTPGPVPRRLRRHGPVCFDGHIPHFVEEALERLHGSIYSTVLRARLDGWENKASSYVLLKEGEPRTALLYRVHGRTLTVLNEVFNIGAHDIAVFAEHMLVRHKRVGVIRFHSIDTDLALLRMPMLKVPAKEDIVVNLPPDQKSYWSALGKTTRQNIKYYRNKLLRDYGDYELCIDEGAGISRAAFDEVASLNRARMRGKGKSYGYDGDTLEHLWRYSQASGMLVRLMVQGRVAAGSICLRCADNWHLDTIGHDPALNEYRLGTLCCWLTIEECIKRSGREFHFLWGQYDYKYRFLGKERKLYDLAIYRSRSSMALQPAAMLGAWSRRARARARDWLSGRH